MLRHADSASERQNSATNLPDAGRLGVDPREVGEAIRTAGEPLAGGGGGPRSGPERPGTARNGRGGLAGWRRSSPRC